MDAARGIGIALVVVGHALAGLRNASLLPAAEPWLFLHRWIYAFHMPLFFFLAGLFLPGPDHMRAGPFLRARVRTIAWPYLLWSVGQTLVQIATGGAANRRLGWDALARIGFQPVMQFWFLYVLFAMLLVYTALTRLGLRPSEVLAVATALYLAPQATSLGPWGVPYALAAHFLYLAAAAALAPRLLPLVRELSIRKAWAVGGAGLAIVAAGVAAGWPAGTWSRVPVAAAGIAAALALGRALTGSALVVDWGRRSLAIFVAHTLASAGARIALDRVFHLTDPSLHVVAGVAAGILVPAWLARLAERRGWRYLYSWPARGTR